MPDVTCPCCGQRVYDASTSREPETRARRGSVKATIARLAVGEATVHRGVAVSVRCAARAMGVSVVTTMVERGVYLVRRVA